LGESFDVALQAVLQPVNFSHDLPGPPGRQSFQISDGSLGV